MTKSRDYIPRNDGEFNNWFKNLCQYVAVKTSGATPAWDHIPKRYVDQLNAAYADWYTAYAPTLKPHTKAETTAKDMARKRAEAVIRPFVKRFLHYEPVTDDDRDNIKIPNHDKKATRISDPVSHVSCDAVFPGVGLVELRNFRPTGGPPPDPRSDFGGKAFYGLTGAPSNDNPIRLSAPPKSGKELPKSRFTTTKKLRFDFTGESGNTVYFSLRYESPTGGEGPYSPVFSVVIP